MKIDLDSDDLRALVKGSCPSYDVFGHPLLKKAGLSYDYSYDKINWTNLKDLSDDELWELYQICKKS